VSVRGWKSRLTIVSYLLEEKQYLPNQQYGFRENRSTKDVLIIFESDIQEAFKEKEHLQLVSLDLQKAYDTCWQYNIIRTLSDCQIKGHMLHFVMSFMKNIKFRDAVGAEMSYDIRALDACASLNTC
jgi:hypothetical protein